MQTAEVTEVRDEQRKMIKRTLEAPEQLSMTTGPLKKKEYVDNLRYMNNKPCLDVFASAIKYVNKT